MTFDQDRAASRPAGTPAGDIAFDDLALIDSLRRAVAEQGYTRPTPIQARAIPPLLEGRDVLGCAQTGTGKTAAFALPILQHLSRAPVPRGKRPIRALVLSPTRELAIQIGDSFEAYGKHLRLTHLVIMGGVNQNPQVAAISRGIDILVATPGRLLDLHGQGHVDLSQVEFFVLDEADRMLDMGFIHDVRKVLRVLPTKRQNLLFSATMPPTIVELAGTFLHDPVHVEVTPQATTVERIEQKVMFVDRVDKRKLLPDLISTTDIDRAIVFTRTKHGANRVVEQLDKAGIRAAAIHGNKSQSARERALGAFRSGEIRILVATDIASRGLDVDGVSHVFNYDLPNEPESYVHRIGRTGRAGRTGLAISFCDPSEGEFLRDIERLIGLDIEAVMDHPLHCAAAVPPPLRRNVRRGGAEPQRPAPRNPRPAPAAAANAVTRGRGNSSAQASTGGRPPQQQQQARAAASEEGGDERRRPRRRGGRGRGRGGAQGEARPPQQPQQPTASATRHDAPGGGERPASTRPASEGQRRPPRPRPSERYS